MGLFVLDGISRSEEGIELHLPYFRRMFELNNLRRNNARREPQHDDDDDDDDDAVVVSKVRPEDDCFVTKTCGEKSAGRFDNDYGDVAAADADANVAVHIRRGDLI